MISSQFSVHGSQFVFGDGILLALKLRVVYCELRVRQFE